MTIFKAALTYQSSSACSGEPAEEQIGCVVNFSVITVTPLTEDYIYFGAINFNVGNTLLSVFVYYSFIVTVRIFESFLSF